MRYRLPCFVAAAVLLAVLGCRVTDLPLWSPIEPVRDRQFEVVVQPRPPVSRRPGRRSDAEQPRSLRPARTPAISRSSFSSTAAPGSSATIVAAVSIRASPTSSPGTASASSCRTIGCRPGSKIPSMPATSLAPSPGPTRITANSAAEPIDFFLAGHLGRRTFGRARRDRPGVSPCREPERRRSRRRRRRQRRLPDSRLGRFPETAHGGPG